MKNASKKEQKLINDAWGHIRDVLCCNDFHSGMDMDNKILETTPLDTKFGDVLLDLLKEAISLQKKLATDEGDEEYSKWSEKKIADMEKIMVRILDSF